MTALPRQQSLYMVHIQRFSSLNLLKSHNVRYCQMSNKSYKLSQVQGKQVFHLFVKIHKTSVAKLMVIMFSPHFRSIVMIKIKGNRLQNVFSFLSIYFLKGLVYVFIMNITQSSHNERSWCSGIIVPSHGTDRGSIPRLRTAFSLRSQRSFFHVDQLVI